MHIKVEILDFIHGERGEDFSAAAIIQRGAAQFNCFCLLDGQIEVWHEKSNKTIRVEPWPEVVQAFKDAIAQH